VDQVDILDVPPSHFHSIRLVGFPLRRLQSLPHGTNRRLHSH
jgi:hypothetical protein